MKHIASCLLAVLVVAAPNAQSLYKWVDPQGNISYSDQPPPPSLQVKDLSNTVNTLGSGQAQAENLPFELTQLVNKSPVVLYTSKGCAPCDLGRNLLRSKQVPFTEKTVAGNADLKALGALFNAQTLPVLGVGSKSVNGFGASQWSETLLEAGYTGAFDIPKSYVNGVATPLAALASPSATPKTNPNTAANKDAAPAAAKEPARRRIAGGGEPAPATEPVVKFQK